MTYSPTFSGIRAALQDRAADLENAGQSALALAEALELSDLFDQYALDLPPEDMARIARHLRALSERRRDPEGRDSLQSLADLCDWRAGGLRIDH